MNRRLSPDLCIAPECSNNAAYGHAHCGLASCGGVYAKQGRSETPPGESGSDSTGYSDKEDRCSHCGRRSGGGEVHISRKQRGDGVTVVYVPGFGIVSVEGTMSIYGQGIKITPGQSVNVVSHRSG